MQFLDVHYFSLGSKEKSMLKNKKGKLFYEFFYEVLQNNTVQINFALSDNSL